MTMPMPAPTSLRHRHASDGIRRAYAETEPYQWVRELTQNALDAKASLIRFTLCWEAIKTLGVMRRVIVNDGRPMTAAEMIEYIGSRGNSSSERGIGRGNFGIGSKDSLLPWNPHGVVYLSKHADGNVLYMRLIANGDDFAMCQYNVDHDPHTGEMHDTMRPSPVVNLTLESIDGQFPWHDPNDNDDLNWANVFPDDVKEGVAVVLLGDSPGAFTVLGDPHRPENDKYGIQRYIQTRYYDFKDNKFKVEVDEVFDWNRDAIGAAARYAAGERDVYADQIGNARTHLQIRKAFSRQRRNARSMRQFRTGIFANGKAKDGENARHVQASWTLTLPASADGPEVKIEATLYSDKTPGGGHMLCPPLMGVIVPSHDNSEEMFEVPKTPASRSRRMSLVVGQRDIQERLVITYEAIDTRAARVHVNATRTEVTWSKEDSPYAERYPLPTRMWLEAIRNAAPIEFTDAVLEAQQKATAGATNAEVDYPSLRAQYGLAEGWATDRPAAGRTGTDLMKREAMKRAAAAKKAALQNAIDGTDADDNLDGAAGTEGADSQTATGNNSDAANPTPERKSNTGSKNDTGSITRPVQPEYSAEIITDPTDARSIYYDPITKWLNINDAHPYIKNIVESQLNRLTHLGEWTPGDADLSIETVRALTYRALKEAVYINAMRHDHNVSMGHLKGSTAVRNMTATDDSAENPHERLLLDAHLALRLTDLIPEARKIANGKNPTRRKTLTEVKAQAAA